MLLLIVILSLIVVQLKDAHKLLTIFMFSIQMPFHVQ